MKRRCKNCGAKLPKKSDICKKCGEEYEYIVLDPETAKLIEVEKPSSMLHICILLLSIVIFIYSLLLIYFHLSGKNKDDAKSMPALSNSSQSSQTQQPEQEQEEAPYYAVDFIGMTFKEAKEILGEQYSIKLSDTTLVNYIDHPLTLSTTDKSLTDSSVISKVIAKDSVFVTTQIKADMTYTELKSLLNLSKPSPEFNQEDSYYYAYRASANDNYSVNLSFKFGFDTADQKPMEVIIDCEELTAKKVYGVVTGLDEGSYLNVRREPLYSSESLCQVFEGDTVEFLSEHTSEDGVKWFEISVNDIKGYSVAEYIVISE